MKILLNESCSRRYDSKIQNCVDAVQNGVRGVILDGRNPIQCYEIFQIRDLVHLFENERFKRYKWLFDLDNTLDGATKVFDQVDKKMSKFISKNSMLVLKRLEKFKRIIFRI